MRFCIVKHYKVKTPENPDVIVATHDEKGNALDSAHATMCVLDQLIKDECLKRGESTDFRFSQEYNDAQWDNTSEDNGHVWGLKDYATFDEFYFHAHRSEEFGGTGGECIDQGFFKVEDGNVVWVERELNQHSVIAHTRAEEKPGLVRHTALVDHKKIGRVYMTQDLVTDSEKGEHYSWRTGRVFKVYAADTFASLRERDEFGCIEDEMLEDGCDGSTRRVHLADVDCAGLAKEIGEQMEAIWKQ